jgi:hypothetical protein
MPNLIEAQIKERIQSFVSELDVLVRKSTLDALRGVLDAGAAPRRGRGPGRPKGSGGGSGNVEGASAKIVAHVQANDGQGVSEVASGAGVSLKVAKKVIIKLLASGQLKKTGQKRGTKYHVGSGRAPRAKAGKRGKKRGRKAKAA